MGPRTHARGTCGRHAHRLGTALPNTFQGEIATESITVNSGCRWAISSRTATASGQESRGAEPSMTTPSQSVPAVAPLRSTTKPMQSTEARPTVRRMALTARSRSTGGSSPTENSTATTPPRARRMRTRRSGPPSIHSRKPTSWSLCRPERERSCSRVTGERAPDEGWSRLTSTARPVTGCPGRSPSTSRSPRSVAASSRVQPRWYEWKNPVLIDAPTPIRSPPPSSRHESNNSRAQIQEEGVTGTSERTEQLAGAAWAHGPTGGPKSEAGGGTLPAWARLWGRGPAPGTCAGLTLTADRQPTRPSRPPSCGFGERVHRERWR
ncbi:protein of unknown function [Streptomyces sp. KY75]|nr:protein of unknown function [Streptomyces sp. KY75]